MKNQLRSEILQRLKKVSAMKALESRKKKPETEDEDEDDGIPEEKGKKMMPTITISIGHSPVSNSLAERLRKLRKE